MLRRVAWMPVVLGVVVALLAIAAPARASEGHCADGAAAAPADGHAAPTIGVATAHEHHRASVAGRDAACPDCTSPECGMLHGCGATAPCAPTALAPSIPASTAGRDGTPRPPAAPHSHVAAPPTPPPLALLSTLA